MAVERTNPAVREVIVVEPLAEMLKREEPEEEETVNKGAEPACPWMVRVEALEVVPMERRCRVLL